MGEGDLPKNPRNETRNIDRCGHGVLLSYTLYNGNVFGIFERFYGKTNTAFEADAGTNKYVAIRFADVRALTDVPVYVQNTSKSPFNSSLFDAPRTIRFIR